MRSDEHVVHEESVIWSGAENSYGLSVLWIPTGEAVHNEQFASVIEVILCSLKHIIVPFSGHLLVDLSPPDLVLLFFGIWLADSLVFR